MLHDIAHLRVHQRQCALYARQAPAFLSQGPLEGLLRPSILDQTLDAPMAGLGLGAVTGLFKQRRNKRASASARVAKTFRCARVPGRRSSIKGSTSCRMRLRK